MSSGTEMRQTLRDALLQYGRALTVTRSVPGAYDPSTGTTSAPSTQSKSGIGRVGDYRDGVIDGTLIKVGDRRVTWQPDDGSFVPSVNDKMDIDGKVCAVMDVKKRELEGDWISYTMQVR